MSYVKMYPSNIFNKGRNKKWNIINSYIFMKNITWRIAHCLLKNMH